MRILLANKFHYLKGGAERSYFDSAKILANNGHELAFFSMDHLENVASKWSKFFVSNIDYNDKSLNFFDKLKASLNIFYNFEARKKMEELIKEFKPDVAHLHSIYRQLSPSIIDALKKYNIPIVMTLHDYALISPARTLSVRGKIWEKDKPNKYYKCLFDKCVKNSYLKSFIAIIEIYLHKWMKIYEKIDIFVSPSEFLIKKFSEYGFKKKIILLPHAVEMEDIKEEGKKDKYILYYGRLSQEKGVDDLIRAYLKLKTDYRLAIVGEGGEEYNLRKIAEESDKKEKIEFLGFKKDKELWSLIRGSEFVVFPTRCYENAPYALLESMGLGKIVLVPENGGYVEAVKDKEDGYFYKFSDVDDFSDKMQYLIEHKDRQKEVEERAKEKIKKRNNKEEYYQELSNIYKKLINK